MSTTTKSAAAEPASKSVSLRRPKRQQEQEHISSASSASDTPSHLDCLYLKQQNDLLMQVVHQMAKGGSGGTHIVLDGENFSVSSKGSSKHWMKEMKETAPRLVEIQDKLMKHVKTISTDTGCEMMKGFCGTCYPDLGQIPEEQNEKVSKKRKRNPRPKKSPQDKKPLCSEDGTKFYFFNLHGRSWYEIEKENVSIVKMEKKKDSEKKTTSVAVAATIHEKVPNKEDPSKFDEKSKNLSRICSLQQAVEVVEKFDVKVQQGLKLKELYEEQKQRQMEKEALKEERRRKGSVRQKKSDQKEEQNGNDTTTTVEEEGETSASSPSLTQKVKVTPPTKPAEVEENEDESDSDENE